MKSPPILTGIGTVCALALIGGLYLGGLRTPVNGQALPPSQSPVAIGEPAREVPLTCVGVLVRSIGVSAAPEDKPNLGSAMGRIEVAPGPAAEVTPGTAGKAVHVVVVGPPLGSMDSPHVKTDVSCTTQGIGLTATITRSADYHDSALKNAVFRPTVDLALVLQQPAATFQVTWTMRLTTGGELDHAQTPPYPDQKYPMTLTATIR